MASLREQRFFRYLVEAFQEVRKVTWPTRNQLTRSTLTVIGFSIAFAIFLGLLDYGLNELLQIIF